MRGKVNNKQDKKKTLEKGTNNCLIEHVCGETMILLSIFFLIENELFTSFFIFFKAIKENL
jgi:hypothetical protein